MKHSFGSDNHSGVHPLIMEAIVKENNNYKIAYGEDNYSKEVLQKLENLLGGNCSAFFVINGTGANVIALSAFLNSYNSILAPSTAHINVDECGAPEKLSGCKIVPLNAIHGKVTPNTVKESLTGFGFQHHSQPKILSISQPTELGTVYTPQEIKELADLMHSHNGYLHIDGSRISNAAAFLNIPIKEFTADCGVDVLSFGGTKNGMMMGEAVVVFNNKTNGEELIPYIRKQATQLLSKSRFIAAQFDCFLEDNLYLKLANQSNGMAQYLADQLKDISQIKLTQPVESNAVFAIIPRDLTDKLLENHYFYVWNEEVNEVRWVCSYSTTKEDIDAFVSDIKRFL